MQQVDERLDELDGTTTAATSLRCLFLQLENVISCSATEPGRLCYTVSTSRCSVRALPRFPLPDIRILQPLSPFRTLV